MGVKTPISLQELNQLFTSYNFTTLTPTLSGIMDTTYIAHTDNESYILKKYERVIPQKIEDDIRLLKTLHDAGLNVPLCLDSNKEWYLYKKLKGSQPLNVKSYHIQALARFLCKLHTQMLKMKCDYHLQTDGELKEALQYTKKQYFSYYKRFEFLKYFEDKNDAIIHGDIFKDNTIFNNKEIGVIDFIDSTCGSFIFDAAVALIGFDVRERDEYLVNTFLRSYNQHAPKKLSKKSLKKHMKIASHFYAVKRIYSYKSTTQAKELLK